MTETYIIEIYINTNCYVHTLPSKHLLVFKTSWRLQDMSWRRLQPLRRIEDVFKTSRKTSSRRLGRRKIVTLKTCLRHALKTSWKHVLKTSRRQTKFLLVIFVSKKSKCVSNKSLFHKLCLRNLRRIQNASLRTQLFRYSSYFETHQHFYFKN